MDIVERIQNGTVRIGLIGLGYVGLPLAVEFGKVFDTVGFDVKPERLEMLRRGKSVPGGACGFWGACGAGISTGMFVSIISRSTPLTDEPFALSHKMTAAALGRIGEIGGPRCCKRDSFLSILTAIDFVKEHFGIALQKPEVVCRYAAQNNQCIGKRCPFSAANH